MGSSGVDRRFLSQAKTWRLWIRLDVNVDDDEHGIWLKVTWKPGILRVGRRKEEEAKEAGRNWEKTERKVPT